MSDTETPKTKKLPEGHVKITVTKAGDGKIVKECVEGTNVYYSRGDVGSAPLNIAEMLEARNYVEID